MGRKIVVAGAGHGGLSAAFTLAKNGYDVTVYEKCPENDLGHDWGDFFDMKAFAAAGMPLPSKGVVDRIPIAYHAPDESIPALYQPEQTGFEMFMERKDILKYLIKHCKSAGVKFVFETEIKEAIILGNRVCGIRTDKEDIYSDLVIDASGVGSAVRLSLPESFKTDKEFSNPYEVLYAYRGMYKRNDVETDDPQYNVFFDYDDEGNISMKWIIIYDDHCDILFGKVASYGFDEVKKEIENFQRLYPQLNDELISGGQVVRIPIRQSPGIFVGNGYAGVGDTAGMTMPVMGSGIAASLRAGTLLAKTVMADVDDAFSAETLWKYQVAYMKNIGWGFASIAIVKSMIPKLTSEDLNFLFGSGVLTNDDMVFSAEDGSVGALLSGVRLSSLLDRAKKAKSNPALIKKLSGIAVNLVKLKSLQSSFPSKYNRQSVEKWAEKYNEFFLSLYK